MSSSSAKAIGVRRTQVHQDSRPANSFVHAAGAVLALAGAALLRGAGAQRSDGSTVPRRSTLVATRPDQVIPWWERQQKPRVESGMGIWAEKINMTQLFMQDGGNFKNVPCTILAVKRGGNYVTDKKWPEKHGYYSIQVGYDQYVPEEWETSGPRAVRLAGLARAGVPPLKKLREFTVRPKEWAKYEVGQRLWASDIFKEGDMVDVHGITKGKGLAGHIKRWGHKRGPMTHGSKHHRRMGSTGAGTDPSRVLPGKKMAAWLGDYRHTQQNVRIAKLFDRIDEDNMPETIIVVEGSVPGYSSYEDDKGGSYVYLHPHKNRSDGRFKRDPVWYWYTHRGEDVNEMIPMKGQAWTWKTFWGRDTRWISHEVKKYWPDGFPGYDHGPDPFYDECDPELAIKAPEW